MKFFVGLWHLRFDPNKKKRESHYLLPVLLLEALELPISVERTTQKPHAEYVYQYHSVTLTRRHSNGYTLLIGIYRCLIPD